VHARLRLFFHVHELQRQLELGSSQERHDLLQIVDLLAGDSHLFVLDGGLDLELAVLDQLDQLAGGILSMPSCSLISCLS
jgi:hypothetical protein